MKQRQTKKIGKPNSNSFYSTVIFPKDLSFFIKYLFHSKQTAYKLKRQQKNLDSTRQGENYIIQWSNK